MSAGRDIWVYWDHLSPNGVPELLGRLTAPFFRLSPQDANAVLAKIRDVTRQWRGYAKACGIPHAAQDLMAPAFRT